MPVLESEPVARPVLDRTGAPCRRKRRLDRLERVRRRQQLGDVGFGQVERHGEARFFGMKLIWPLVSSTAQLDVVDVRRSAASAQPAGELLDA